MIYTFMSKNTELFDVKMIEGQAEKLLNHRKENQHLLPVYLLPQRQMGVSRASFQNWWSGRRIPASRDGVKELIWHLIDKNHILSGLDELSEKALGLSLSDQYWIRPNESVRWDDVNFFQNDFSEDIGKLLITGMWRGGDISSPDNTSDGMLKKKWKIIDGTRYLIKGSYSVVGIPQPQPFREVYASKIAEILMGCGFAVPYSLYFEERKDGELLIFSKCPNFVTTDTEYVSFNQINASNKKPNNISEFDFFKQFYGLHSDILDLIIILDYIVLNEDRHYGNFGLLRDVNTGEFLRPAPVFDSGSSLFFDSTRVNSRTVNAKPFRVDFEKQIQLVNVKKYADRIDLVKQQYLTIFNETFANSPEPAERKEKLAMAVKEQIHKLLIIK